MIVHYFQSENKKWSAKVLNTSIYIVSADSLEDARFYIKILAKEELGHANLKKEIINYDLFHN